MNNLSKIIFCLFVICNINVTSSFAAEKLSLQEMRVKINKIFQDLDEDDINLSPVEGWYTLKKGMVIAYISEDGRYLFQGNLIDLDNQMNLTELTRSRSRQILLSSVKEDQFITFSPNEVKHSVVVFTDIDCIYCRRLHSQIDDYLSAGIEIRYLLYPRNGPSSNSWNISEAIWCAFDRNDALTAAKLDKTFASSDCNVSAISNQYTLGQSVGLTGTPAMVFESGSLVNGYLPPDELLNRLQMEISSTIN
tara:strand:- start:1874 stop:2623 length:750 start_codon:yes stop_codon:yes gene_type:complete